MVSVPIDKADSPKGLLSNLLSLKDGVKDDKFSALLKSFSFARADLTKLDAKDSAEGLEKLEALLELEEKPTSKTSALTKLFALGNNEAELKDKEYISTDILKALPVQDFTKNLKLLIGDAKDYLKDQISKKVDIKELPKTLGGLIKLAEKSGVDVKAIDFESLPQTEFKQKLDPLLQLNKQALTKIIPHSTKELVLAEPIKEKKVETKPLNALLKGSLEKENIKVSDELISGVNEIKTEKVSKKTSISPTLSSLLHSKDDKTETESLKLETVLDKPTDKAQAVLHQKTEQLGSKITEAKQLIQHMSQNIKDSIENYKPPFTRIKMQLNPQKFGEMDVTMVQRGNNVHININANTSALTVMMQNSHELKAALSAQGLGDASMNFSSHQQQQQEKQKQENAFLTYEEYQDLKENSDDEFLEVATSLEVVVPRYI